MSKIEKMPPLTKASSKTYPVSEEPKQKIKRECTKLKDARRKHYELADIEKDYKVLSEHYEERNSPEVKALVEKYNLHSKYIVKQLLAEKIAEHTMSIQYEIDFDDITNVPEIDDITDVPKPQETQSLPEEISEKEEQKNTQEAQDPSIDFTDAQKDFDELNKLTTEINNKNLAEAELYKKIREINDKQSALLKGRQLDDLNDNERSEYEKLSLELNKLSDELTNIHHAVLELRTKIFALEDKYSIDKKNPLKLKQLHSLLKNHIEPTPTQPTQPSQPTPTQPTQATPVQPVITQSAPVYTISPEREKVAEVKPIAKELEVALPTKSDLARRKVEGNKFSYYAPVYDKENNLTRYTFKEVDIDKEFLDDPVKAYKLALKDAARNKKLWKNLNCENETDIKKLCKELQKDFSHTYSHFQNYDECLKKILTLRSAITPEELEKAVNECEYYDKSKYEPVKVVPYENQKFNIHSVGDFFRGLFNPNLVSLRINESLPASTEKPETYKWPNPETGELETLTRHRRMDRYKNKNKSKDKDSIDIEP